MSCKGTFETKNVMHLFMRSARNTMGTRGTLEWHLRLVAPTDLGVGEDPGRWERLPPTETKRHEGKAISYK